MRKFTFFALDSDRYPLDPYVSTVEARSAAELFDAIRMDYARAALGAGITQDRANIAWSMAGASLVAVVPGEFSGMYWESDPAGISEADLFAHGFTYDREPETAAELLARVDALPLSEKFAPPWNAYYKSPLDACDEWNADQADIWNRAIKFVRRTLKGGDRGKS